MAEAKRDQNRITTLIGVSNADGVTPTVVYVDPVTHRLLVDLAIVLLTATGTVDDSNTQFTFTSQPTLVNVNGLFYRINHGWTWNAGTLTATIAAPVGSGGDIFGL